MIELTMKKKNMTFSLFDFCKRRADKVEIYGKESLDENGDIISFIDQAAYVTHYLQLKRSNIGVPYADKAEELLSMWYEFVIGKEIKDEIQGGMVAESSVAMQQYLFPDLFQAPFQAPHTPKFTFIDLFAGIGGFRMAFQNLGGECVFSSEWDEQARKTYYANYGDVPFGDITKESVKNKIPQGFDILCAGFPCQAFSIIGKQKGFADTRGTMFFEIQKILQRHRPKAIFMENVKQLVTHDKGKTFKVILGILADLGYYVKWKVLNALDFGVPQKRERVIIVGFLDKKKTDLFSFDFEKKPYSLSDILQRDDEVDESLFVSDRILQKRKDSTKDKNVFYPSIWHENKAGNISVLDYACALRTGASYNYLLVNGYRRPSSRELLRLQGFPEDFRIVVSHQEIRRQTGNSVAVPMMTEVAKRIKALL